MNVHHERIHYTACRVASDMTQTARRLIPCTPVSERHYHCRVLHRGIEYE